MAVVVTLVVVGLLVFRLASPTPSAAGASVLVPTVVAVVVPGEGTPPKVRDVRPVYPALAQSAHVEGEVAIEATVGLDGKISAARVARSVPLLDQAALDAVRQWEFAPREKGGASDPLTLTVTVRFSLNRVSVKRLP